MATKTPSQFVFRYRSSRARRHSRSMVHWSWLHAMAYSSAVVASIVYMHKQLTIYFHSADAQQVDNKLLYDLSTVATSGIKQLDGLHLVLSDLASTLRWLLVMLSLAVWLTTLLVSRRCHLYSLLCIAATRLGCYVHRLREWSCKQRHGGKRRRHRHKHKQASCLHQSTACVENWNEMDVEIDEDDLLIVSSLSSAPRRHRSVEKQASDVDEHSGQGRWSSDDTGSDSLVGCRDTRERAEKIVLHPREGARGGRHQNNQIISNDSYVSRLHFQIQYDPMEKEYYLQDLGSTTGTFVFLKPDAPKRLHVNDRVKLGDTEFEVCAINETITTGMPFLRMRFTEGPLTGICQTIGKTSVTLGRYSSNALCITEDDSISGKHSAISYFGNGFYITDLHSTNGTAIRLSGSGRKSRRRYLLHGDVFGVGSNRFMVEYSHQLAAQRRLAKVINESHEDEDDRRAESES
ncbi:unnamed protein product [Hyaloperonospora brassicae]|uniref:FHA domain-containing protein n=1 Tax=Hyaloperonospora brassicae TaxID=162125 RepID=A0AAV0SZ93_HYABA|nr:unnamed protein product [Hyaloperonospora brassicae]